MYIKGRNCEWCQILNGQTILQFANFWTFDSLPNFQILEICLFSNLENSKDFDSEKFHKFSITKLRKSLIRKISQFPKFYNFQNYQIFTI